MAELFDLEEPDNNEDVNNQPEDLDTQDNLQDDEDNNTQAQAPELPDKYRGKTLDEIIRMHQEAEKLIGRQAQEVGETRKLVDDLIKQQINKPQVESEAKQEIDFFEDPNKAINQAIDNHPAVLSAKQAAEQSRIAMAVATIEKQHPDYMEIANSADFGEWVKSSKVRLQMYASAVNYDVDSALELLSTYKAIKGVSQAKADAQVEETIQADKAQRKQNLKAASVQTGGSGETPQKFFRRQDILRLMMYDRERYHALEPEIRQAYAEGRVKG